MSEGVALGEAPLAPSSPLLLSDPLSDPKPQTLFCSSASSLQVYLRPSSETLHPKPQTLLCSSASFLPV